jgi:hypothetical protein
MPGRDPRQEAGTRGAGDFGQVTSLSKTQFPHPFLPDTAPLAEVATERQTSAPQPPSAAQAEPGGPPLLFHFLCGQV